MEPYKELTDTDPMPWGTYVKQPMQDVPAQYFHYLWHNGMRFKVGRCPVADYVQKNIKAFQKENKDLIWS